ncbi:MAG: DUF2785 domain-containing protein [Nocardioides sp.]|uniref:DUF2785 domain-containing protein n=1 Tax=Nocardioides sp. TaxID=35761 RepID=UPI003F0F0CA6
MVIGYWHGVMSSGLSVPTDRPLDDLTVELTTMLGSSDPAERDGIALPALSTWISQGVYDDHLTGLGDGMLEGLKVGLGEQGTDSVYRRSFSAVVVTECVARANAQGLLSHAKLLEWGDHVASWWLRERDTRGYVPHHGWAHAIAHGADAIGEIASSPFLGATELTVLLDVVADRVLDPDAAPLLSGEPDRIAGAVRKILLRGEVPLSVVEPWLVRIVASAGVGSVPGEHDPYLVTYNPQTFLRCLHLHLELGRPAVPQRADLLLSLVDALQASNPYSFGRRH